MKLENLTLFGALVALNLMACSKPVTIHIEAAAAPAAGERNETKIASPAAEVIEKCVGGEPGKIDVRGVAVKTENDVNSLDSRLLVSQKIGLSETGAANVKISETNRISISSQSESAPTTISTQNTYINFGCKLSANLVLGLTEVKPEIVIKKDKELISAQAATIFICGEQSADKVIFFMKADEIILKNVSMKIKNFTGVVSIAAYKLQLFGKNSITTEGLAIGTSFFTSPPILLDVKQSLSGTGQLSLTTAGGNCANSISKQ